MGLLGQGFTNQYLSQSVNLRDRISFALLPIGVPFALRAAIKVSYLPFPCRSTGVPEIYRQTVDNMTEKEFLSSTSQSVCEVWNGHEVERRTLNSFSDLPIREFVAAKDDNGNFSLYRSKLPTVVGAATPFRCALRGGQEYYSYGDKLPNDTDYPPNLSLNLGPYNRNFNSWSVFIAGLVLQAAVWVFAALTTFNATWKSKFSFKLSDIPLPFFVLTTAGSGLLSFCLWKIAHTIGKPAPTTTYIPNLQRKPIWVIWVQKENEALGLKGYILIKEIKKELISVHRYDDESIRKQGWVCSYFTTVFIVLGFLAQSVGLSLMHWPTQTFQFLSIAIMFGLRYLLHKQSPPDFIMQCGPPRSSASIVNEWQKASAHKVPPLGSGHIQELLWFNAARKGSKTQSSSKLDSEETNLGSETEKDNGKRDGDLLRQGGERRLSDWSSTVVGDNTV